MAGLVLLATLAAPARAQQVAPFHLDTLPVIVHDEMNTQAVAVAMGDSIGLVIWHDDGYKYHRASRIDRHLRLLDTLSLWDENYGVPTMAVAASDHNFLVVGIMHGIGYGVYGVIIESDGTVHEPFVISTGSIIYWRVAVGYNGTNYVVAWDDQRHAFFHRVSTTGEVLDPTPRPVAPLGGNTHSNTSVAGRQGWTLMVYHQGDSAGRVDYGLYGNLLRPDGTLRDSVGFPIRFQQHVKKPCVTACSSGFVVAWREETPESTSLRVTYVSPSGEVPDPEGTIVTLDAYAPIPAVGANGDTVVVAWKQNSDTLQQVLARRFGVQVGLLDSVDIALFEPQSQPTGDLLWPYDPAVFPCDSGFAVAWSHWFGPDSGARNRDVVCRRVTRSGRLPDTQWPALSWSANAQWAGYVAGYGGVFFAPFADFYPDAQGIPSRVLRFMRFDGSGRLLDSIPRRTPIVDLQGPGEIAVAACSLGFVVVFNDTAYVLRYLRFGLDGRALDSVPRLLMDEMVSKGQIDVCATPMGFLALWSKIRGGSLVLYTRRFTWDGVLGDTVLSVPDAGQNIWSKLHAGPGNVLVLYDGNDKTRARKLDFTGAPISDRLTLWNTWPYASEQPAAAYGDGYYAVFHHRRNEVLRVPADAARPPDSVPIFMPFQNFHRAALVFDGSNFVALSQLPDGELSAARVSPDGVLLDSVPIHLGSDVVAHRTFGFCTMDDTAAVVYSQYEGRPYLTERARAFVLPPLTTGLAGTAPGLARRPLPTILRGALFLPGRVEAELLDVSGRRAAHLSPGDNDLRGLAPGVYFVLRGQSTGARKVMLAN